MLHILRHGPRHSSFMNALNTISPGQYLLLIEDAIYALLPGTESARALGSLPQDVELYVLEVDLLARGLSLSQLPQGVKPIDYLRMVDLCASQPKVLSW